MFRKKYFIIAGIVIIVAALATLVILMSRDGGHNHEASESEVSHYTCGMHPSVHVSPEEYEDGNKSCPICGMNLVPVMKETTEKSYYGCGMEGEEHVFFLEDAKGMKCPICGMDLMKLTEAEADKLKGIAGKVKIKGEQAKLAGVKTEALRKLPLFKEIQTVGKVAYDSELAIAEEEYVSALRALDKISRGNIPEIKRRSVSLVDSAEKKLKLLGLSDSQIKEIKKTRRVHTNLLLPESKMWIYGEVYEYELNWLKIGEKIKVQSTAFPGETFEGVITSINPVVDAKTRSIRFRAEVDNIDLKLKPNMYVDIVIMSNFSKDHDSVLAIPKNAILDTGKRKIVWFDKGDGLYEGREIVIGPEASTTIDGKSYNYYPIIKGAKEGELVVTKSNFLIDSQSQLSGAASSAYSGALNSKEKSNDKEQKEKTAPVHRH